MSTESDLLRAFAKGLQLASPLFPGVGPAVGRIAAAALLLGADFAESGADAIVSIERIRKTDPVLKQLRDDWNEAIRDKFGSDSSVPPDSGASQR